jgi:uncharacterized DUF497 family protein
MGLVVSDKIRQKLALRHGVNEEEIRQCFASREKKFLEDTRENHKTNPPSKWFVAQTDFGRVLKVVFMYFPDTGEIHIKTAYEANPIEIEIYERHA